MIKANELITIHPFDFFVLLRDCDATDISYEGEVDGVVLYRIKATLYRVTCRTIVLTDEFELPRGDGFARYKTNPSP